MKKIITTFIVFTVALMSIQSKAQVTVENNINEKDQVTDNRSNDDDKNKKKASGFELEYQGIEKGFGIGLNIFIKNVYLSVATLSFDDIEKSIRNRSGWNVSAGYDYRYYLAKIFYIEGRAGIGYEHVSAEYAAGEKSTERHSISGTYTSTSTEWKKEGNGEFFLTVNPRVGVKVCKIWGSDFNIIAGYRWDFVKFKFDKDNTIDYFTVGAAFTF